MFGPFIDLATALGQKVASAFITKQGVQTPRQRPVSTQGDSFDFYSGFQKLLSPVTNLFSPTTKAGVQVLEGASKVGDEIFNSLGRNVGSYIDNLFGNGNKINSAAAREKTNNVREDLSFNSQGLALGDAFKLFSQIQGASPHLDNPPAVPQQNNNTVLIIGGFVALAAVLILTGRKGNA